MKRAGAFGNKPAVAGMVALCLVCAPDSVARAADSVTRVSGSEIVVAATTSMESSGLFARIVPLFEAKTGIRVRAVPRGTGQALRMARRGDADVVFVHDRPSE